MKTTSFHPPFHRGLVLRAFIAKKPAYAAAWFEQVLTFVIPWAGDARNALDRECALGSESEGDGHPQRHRDHGGRLYGELSVLSVSLW